MVFNGSQVWGFKEFYKIEGVLKLCIKRIFNLSEIHQIVHYM